MKKNNFKNYTRRLFLKYAIIPIVVVFLLFSIFIIILLDIKVIFETREAATNLENEVITIYDEYVKQIDEMVNLPELQNVLKNKTKHHLVYEAFYQFNNQAELRSIFHLIDAEGVFLVSTSPRKEEHDRYILNDLIPRMNGGEQSIYIDFERSEFDNGLATVWNFGKPIYDGKTIIGYIVFQLLEEGLQEIIFNEKSDIVVMTDEFDYVIVTTNRVTLGLMNKFIPSNLKRNSLEIKDRPYYMNKKELSNGAFTIYVLNDKRNDPIILFTGIFFIIIMGILIYLLLIKMAERMSNRTVKSIDKLMVAVNKLQQGDMKAYVSIHTGDEFEILATQYNEMLDSLNELIDKNEELSEVRKTTEMKLLQSKFNPHFLFNVLETLRNMMFVDKEKAQEMIYSLSRILRYSVDDYEEEVLFENDLNHILDYLVLHKYRFGDRLMYAIDLDNEVRSAYVPKLILQPIIENAIKYGYKHSMNLSIVIRGKIKGDQLEFTIVDNGGGIEKERYNKIIEVLKNSSHDNVNELGIGLTSTNRRLKLQYGDEYGLTLLNEPNKGLTVTIKLPLITSK